ncbi:VOC family protein [Amycolatopsis rhabdoformis]|uniref:VOC family protein n=1 Tax=Amycolatopsis rhabdoformis TaxID=1448059 RepID=A0ABZ1ICC2_9PSEU|nr:VOC family protein [Amycolatopsis rhabdoformis]WSE31283.1 VOC family protein [Amycolatopsis rhabdoformis]
MRHITGLDHCVLLVRDLSAARDTFARLGFTVSPFGRHSAEMGTANHAVMLAGNYVELLGVLEPTPFNQDICQAVAAREGVAGLALRTDDTAAAVAEARAAGVTVTEPHRVGRDVGLPGGGTARAEFSIAFFPEVGLPYLQLFCNEIRTPEYTWLPELMSHPNTAERVERLGVVTGGADLGITAAFGDVSVVELVAGEYPEAVAPGSTVLSLRVRDVEAARKCLREKEVPFRSTGTGVVVPPRYACGVVVEMREGEGR